MNNFNQTIHIWIKEIEQNNFDQIIAKPGPNSWSLGQVCVHLMDATHYFLEQIKICSATNDHVLEETSPAAKIMFQNNELPDRIFEGRQPTPIPGNLKVKRVFCKV